MGLIVCAKYCCFKPLKSSYQTHTEDKTALYDVQTTACEVRKQQHNTLSSLWSLLSIFHLVLRLAQDISVYLYSAYFTAGSNTSLRDLLMISSIKKVIWLLNSETIVKWGCFIRSHTGGMRVPSLLINYLGMSKDSLCLNACCSWRERLQKTEKVKLLKMST